MCRGTIPCQLLARLLEKAGMTQLIVMDLHQKEIQGFFSIPVDNLKASAFLVEFIQSEVERTSDEETNTCHTRISF